MIEIHGQVMYTDSYRSKRGVYGKEYCVFDYEISAGNRDKSPYSEKDLEV